MAVLSKYAKQRILALKESGVTSSGIVVQILENEGITTSAQTVRHFYIRYCQSGSIARRRGSGRPTILTDGVLQTIDQTMRENDETMVADLQRFFHQQGFEITLTTIQRGRRHLGWTFRSLLLRQQNLLCVSSCSLVSSDHMTFSKLSWR